MSCGFVSRTTVVSVVTGAWLLTAVTAGAQGLVKPTFGTPVAPPVATASAVVVNPGPAYRIATPYMYAADIDRMTNWFVKADGSGKLTVTLIAGLESKGRCPGCPDLGTPPTGPYGVWSNVTASIWDEGTGQPQAKIKNRANFFTTPPSPRARSVESGALPPKNEKSRPPRRYFWPGRFSG